MAQYLIPGQEWFDEADITNAQFLVPGFNQANLNVHFTTESGNAASTTSTTAAFIGSAAGSVSASTTATALLTIGTGVNASINSVATANAILNGSASVVGIGNAVDHRDAELHRAEVPEFAPVNTSTVQTFSNEDLFALLENLLPEGPAFPRLTDSTQTAFLKALADTEEFFAVRASNLLVDSFPSTSIELLPEWEGSLGLPDPCWGPAPTLNQRQKSVVARLTAQGGQSLTYLSSVVEALGFPNTTFTEYTAYRFGMPFGLPMNSVAWNYTLGVTGIGLLVHFFLFGHDNFGEPFAWWDNNPLMCEIRRIAPGHLYLVFSFIAEEQLQGVAQFEIISIGSTTSVTAHFSGPVVEAGNAVDVANFIAATLEPITEHGSAQTIQDATRSISTLTRTEAGTASTQQAVAHSSYVVSRTETGSAATTTSSTVAFRSARTETGAANTTYTIAGTYPVVEQGNAADSASATAHFAAARTETRAATTLDHEAIHPFIIEFGAAQDVRNATGAYLKSVTEVRSAADSPSINVSIKLASRTEAGAATDHPSAAAVFVASRTETQAAQTGDRVGISPFMVEVVHAQDIRNAVATFPKSVAETGAASTIQDAGASNLLLVHEFGAAATSQSKTTASPAARTETGAANTTQAAVPQFAKSVSETGAANTAQDAFAAGVVFLVDSNGNPVVDSNGNWIVISG